MAKTKQESEEKAEQQRQAEAESRQALATFRSYLAQSPDSLAARALPNDSELQYNYDPATQECKITRTDGGSIVLDISRSKLQGELPLPPQLMVTWLDCRANQLTTLPELPASLTELICYTNPELANDPATQAALQAMRDRGATVRA